MITIKIIIKRKGEKGTGKYQHCHHNHHQHHHHQHYHQDQQHHHHQYHHLKERRERDREERAEVSSDGKSILIQGEDGEMV